jgi:hypothetical protein
MALIVLTSIGCIMYLALGTVLMHAMFCRWQQERKLDLFFPSKKAQDVHQGEVHCVSFLVLAGKVFGVTYILSVQVAGNSSQNENTF